MAYGARLESGLGATPRGFKSRILRHTGPQAADTPAASSLAGPSVRSQLRPADFAAYSARSAASRVSSYERSAAQVATPAEKVSAGPQDVPVGVQPGQGRGGLGRGGCRQDEHELLAAVAGAVVAAPQRRAQHRAEVGEHLVADVVALGVVEHLEVVEVAQRERVAGDRRRSAARRGRGGSRRRSGRRCVQRRRSASDRALCWAVNRDSSSPSSVHTQAPMNSLMHTAADQPPLMNTKEAPATGSIAQRRARRLGQPDVGEAEREQARQRRVGRRGRTAQEHEREAHSGGEDQRGARAEPLPGDHEREREQRRAAPAQTPLARTSAPGARRRASGRSRRSAPPSPREAPGRAARGHRDTPWPSYRRGCRHGLSVQLCLFCPNGRHRHREQRENAGDTRTRGRSARPRSRRRASAPSRRRRRSGRCSARRARGPTRPCRRSRRPPCSQPVVGDRDHGAEREPDDDPALRRARRRARSPPSATALATASCRIGPQPAARRGPTTRRTRSGRAAPAAWNAKIQRPATAASQCRCADEIGQREGRDRELRDDQQRARQVDARQRRAPR